MRHRGRGQFVSLMEIEELFNDVGIATGREDKELRGGPMGPGG